MNGYLLFRITIRKLRIKNSSLKANFALNRKLPLNNFLDAVNFQAFIRAKWGQIVDFQLGLPTSLFQ